MVTDEAGSGERDLTPWSGGRQHKALFAFMRPRASERFRGGTKCPTPIERASRMEQWAIVASRAAFAPSVNQGRFAESPCATWESNLGEGVPAPAGEAALPAQ